MKKYLLTLCLTMLGFVASWAQTGWSIATSSNPVTVEVNSNHEYHKTTQGWYTDEVVINITAPDGATGYSVEAIEAAPSGVTAGSIATPTVSYDAASSSYKATFEGLAVGITYFYIQVKNGGSVVSTTEATPFEVNVYDKGKARYIINPGDQIVDMGKKTNLEITFAPTSAASGATITVSPSTGSTIGVANTLVVKDVQNTIVTLEIDATSATRYDEVEITIAPPSESLDRNGQPVPSVTFKVKADLPELPVEYYNTTREFRVGKEFPTPLKIKSEYASEIGTNYTESYVKIPVAGYDGDVVTIDPDAHPITLTNNHAGYAQVKGIFEPKGDAATKYRTWERILNISVLPAKYGLTFTVSQNGNIWTPTPAVTIDPTPNAVVTDPTDNSDSKYTIKYSVEGALEGTYTLDEETGVVEITNPDVSQKFSLVATLTPTNEHDFIGAKAIVPITVGGTVTGAFLEKQEDGTTWIAYLASPEETGENIVANFEVRTKVAADSGKKPWELLDDLRSTGKVINVSGNINSFNIAQLAHAVGVAGNQSFSGTMKTIDMSGCQMFGPLEFSHTKAGSTDPVPNYNFPVTGVKVEYKDPETGTVLKEDATRVGQQLSFKNVESFVFPKPDTSNPEYTVIPAGFHKFIGNQYNPADNNLTSLSFPEGWTEIEDGFSGLSKAAHYTTSAMAHLTELKLANTIEKIGAYAFSDLKVKVLTMPYNIHRIDDHAFNMSSALQDVYFTGPAPEYVHTFAFAGVSQMCNNTVVGDVTILNGKVDPEITRYPYTNNGILGCLLHFPEQYRSTYTDVTRVYRRLTPAEAAAKNFTDAKYSKGYKLYKPEGWTDAFVSTVNARSPKDPNAGIPTSGTEFRGVDYGAKDQYYGEDMIWPSQDQMQSGYAIAQAGKTWGGQDLGPDLYNPSATYENGGVDRRGLLQFIVAMSNADIHFKFAADQWYTIALPFNMTPAEIRKVFGNKTQVCRFSKVTRVKDGDEKQIKLEFRKSTMGDRTGDLDGINYNGYVNPYPNDVQADEYKGDKPGIIHHFPYMIKPSGTTDNEYVTHTDDGNGNITWEFKGLDFPRLSGTLHPETVVPHNDDTHPGYTFAPILSNNRIKPNSYILVERTDKPKYTLPTGHAAYRHEYVFYKGVKKYSDAEKTMPVVDGDGNYVYEPGGNANQNTAYIQLPITASGSGTFTEIDWGKEDLDTFFGGSKAPAQTGAKLVNTLFVDDEDDATEIEKVVIVCGQDGLEDNIVYTINGVRVNADYLPAGLYIKNGKKFIVK